jgi:hypothetical protein
MTIKHTKKTHATGEGAATTSASKEPAGAPEAATVPATKAKSQKTTTPMTTTHLVPPPPLDLNIPTVPLGFKPIDIRDYTGILPKAAQLAVMAGAVTELQNFTDFLAVFGKSAPPYAAVVQAFEAASGWSGVRAEIDTFDVYATTQEALAWKLVHEYMVRMSAAFELVIQSDGSVATDNPSLVRLFAAQKEIAQKSASTKKANAQLAAEGKMPTKGKVGQRRKRAAANALLAAAQSTAPPTATVSAGASGVNAGAGAASSSSSAPSGGAGATNSAPGGAGATSSGANGGASTTAPITPGNGASH